MSARIRVLDEQTINKIAAGEVIENPASVVKELVENSLDAGAKEIYVEIKGGGRQLIRITDDGFGMNVDDALLCLERHATSKIRSVEDIYEVGTMGFRGEAIPSIAAISKFTLITTPQGGGTDGTIVTVEGGKIIQSKPAARSPGTTIEVQSLFFNIPVRRKFQKSPAYDANEILKVMNHIALGYPHVKFQLINDQKMELSAPMPVGTSFHEQIGERIKDILGADFFENSCLIEGEEEGFHLKGYIGLPAHSRHNRSGQYLFINQRSVFSPLVAFAIREGYGTTLPSQRHPVYVLHLSLAGSLVDVNVHPQKREVRLRQEQALKAMILKAISKALQGIPQNIPSYSQGMLAAEWPGESIYITEKPREEKEPMALDQYIPEAVPLPVTAVRNFVEPALFTTISSAKPSPRVLATIRQYIVIESIMTEGLCLVDQRAAHFRVIFEKLQQKHHHAHRLAVQNLLIPYTFQVTPEEHAVLTIHLDRLNSLGISLRQGGPNAFLLDAIPEIFGNTDMQALVVELVHSLYENDESSALDKEYEKQISLAASRAAIPSSKRLSTHEAQSLLDQLFQCQTPHHCPLGKPIFASFSYEELNKKFQKG